MFFLFWLSLFGLLMFSKYSVAMLVGVFLLCPFSVKMAIKKSVSLWRPFQYIFCMLMIKTFKHSHYSIWCYVWVWFYLYICYWSFPNDFEIRRVINSVCDSCIKETELLRIHSCIVLRDLHCSGCLKTVMIVLYCYILHVLYC